MGHENYKIEFETFLEKIPLYLRTPGSTTYKLFKSFYDIYDNYATFVFDVWENFNLKKLLTDYNTWSAEHPVSPDSEWKYTLVVEGFAKTYGIVRERNVLIEGVPTTIILTNRNMLRLVMIEQMKKTFGGTKKEMVDLYKQVLFYENFPFVMYYTDHATAKILISDTVADDASTWDDNDTYLFEDNQYIIQVLGIIYACEFISFDTLVYDIGMTYDDAIYYDFPPAIP